MKVTYNWLKDFVDIKIPAEKLADKLTAAGLEVTSLEKKEGDFVFEIEVTSNRPDWLSVLGVAREVAAITGKRLVSLPVGQLNRPTGQPANRPTIDIGIHDKTDCPLYIGRIIRNLKVGPSPEWLKRRLELAGCRSVNNVVDVTNYVLFELGEPLHAFDLDKLVSRFASLPRAQARGLPVSRFPRIIVRRAKEKEEIITIDEVKRQLNNEILVIASEDCSSTGQPANRPTGQPIAIAGVMGGKDSEVTNTTKNILLEAAIFNPQTIRHARQKLGLQSESAYRFERGIDAGIAEPASCRAAQLLAQLAGGECALAKASAKLNFKKNKVGLNIPRANKILGLSITAGGARKILQGLGFQLRGKVKDNITVEVPSYRQDVRAEIDLTEELARIHGFDRIPATVPALRTEIIPDKDRDMVSELKNILIGLGLNEVITYSLVDKALLQKEAAAILNPLSSEQEFLRPQLIPSLVACVSRNLNYKQDCVNIFEVAKTFSPWGAGGLKEELSLGIALCGTKSYFLEQGLAQESLDLLHLKGILEALFQRLGATGVVFTKDTASVIGVYIGADKIGEMGLLEKGFLEKLEIKNKEVAAAELSLEKLFSHKRQVKIFVPPPKYPGITRDISLVLSDDIPIARVLQAAGEKGRPFLCEVKVTDYYKGRQIPDGHIGLTISCVYRCGERTLNESEVNPVHVLICSLLTETFSAKIR